MSKRVDFDKFTGNYDQLLQEQMGFFSKSDVYFAQYKVDLARSLIKQPVTRVLQYDCGTGRNIPFLKSAFPGAKVVGSDISKASLALAKSEQPSVDFLVEGEGGNLIDGFELIFVAGVFHHIPPPARLEAMKLLNSRLAPHGQIIIFEHNPYNPVTRRIVSNCAYDEDAQLLPPRELRALLSNAGFLQVRHGYCLFIPPSFSKLLWLERHLSWLPLGGQFYACGSKC